MRHKIKIAVACIALGVLSNLLVAWGCVVYGSRDPQRVFLVRDADAAAIGWTWPVPSDWPEPNRAGLSKGFGWEQFNVGHEEPVPPAMLTPDMHPVWSPHSTTRNRSGFPFLSFEARWITPQSPEEVQRLQSSQWHRWGWWYNNGFWVEFANGMTLPLRPVWPPFLAGSALWAGIWALLLPVPRFIRSRRRQARGLCEACRYPVAGLDVCPECGKQARRAVRTH
jgi:hypothetical protein